MKPGYEVVIGADGALATSGKPGRDLLGGRAGRHVLVAGPPGLLLLKQVDGAGAKRDRVIAAGELVSQTSTMEMISAILNNGWSGEFSVWDMARTRRMRIDQGALKAASSDEPNERLGEVMVSSGVLTATQLALCVSSASASRRIGEVAIEKGFINRQQLFSMLQTQAERIFHAALLVATGSYDFAILADDIDAPSMSLHLPVQALLMEGVQRIDEMAHFRQRIPSGDLRPALTDSASRVTFGETLRPVAALADGQHSIHDIGRVLRMEEFEVTKKVMQLLQLGCLELKEQQTLNRESVERIVRQLNEVLREIEDTVERHGGTAAKDRMLSTLGEWVRNSQLVDYFGAGVGHDGDISSDATLQQLTDSKRERPVEGLHAAAHELVSFVMLCASPNLPREAERALAKWVNQRVTRIRL